jgi:hypothetical protein
MTPDNTHWAVYLGCNTARRLAREWSITKYQAARLLGYACDRKIIRRASRGCYEAVMP